jgi:hypothetical protein
MQAETHTSQDSVLDLLAIPGIAGLSEHQVRGMACVWDGIALTPATAVDLGMHSANRAGEPVSWYPRGCRGCTSRAAYRALLDHTQDCRTCKDSAPGCDQGHALQQLAKQGRAAA